ncbi:hypothetical protein SCLARK_001848 [Spiroplasma clarkii]|uniref:hypothetical protein n=1 Tax=Spiroplasma clarkii TaxID=2139 RepID=UPI000B584749|nr:hypothetical protein [Spiroplasma clarkii]ARU92287.1 hypothetical protein SCLARK_001848 [Spiroplasma clarkii]
MNIFIALIACLSYTTITFIVYVITWGLSRHIFEKIKIYYEFLLGFGLGVVSLFGIIVLAISLNNPEWLNLTVLLPIFYIEFLYSLFQFILQLELLLVMC